MRKLIDAAGPSAVVAELSGDLNKEYIYAAGAASYGFTAVGVSPRGGNDPGFQRVILSDNGGQVTEVESYQMKRGARPSRALRIALVHAWHRASPCGASRGAPHRVVWCIA